jgi:hypothetical protein
MIKASDYSFEELRQMACQHRLLGVSLSLVQVEFGIFQLREHWQAYCDFCDAYGMFFEDEDALCQEFSRELLEHVRILSDIV